MSKLVFDAPGDRWVETGVSKGVLYVYNTDGHYNDGVAWNGLISISEQPDGGEQNKIYSDNIVYASLFSPEVYKATIEAYTYPDEFMECDGTFSITRGVSLGQQKRKKFGLCYRTEVVNQNGNIDGEFYKLHIIYNLLASPSEKSYESVNDSPDAITLSWDVDAIPITAINRRYSNSIVIDTSKIYKDLEYMRRLQVLEKLLYGDENTPATLPSPLEVANIMNGGDMRPASIRQLLVDEFKKYKIWIWDTFNFTTMTIPEAIANEAEYRIITDYSSSLEIPIPGIGYKLILEGSDYCDYEVTINDSYTGSEVYIDTKSRFKGITLREITSHDESYSYICDLHANVFS